MESCTAALDQFKKYEQFILTQTGKKVHIVHMNNIHEYTEGDFKKYFDARGIICRTTALYSPAQNGIAECLNRTLVEHARAVLFTRHLPHFLWEDTIGYMCYLKNRSPTYALTDMIPYKVFWGRKPDINGIYEFGTHY